MVEWPEREQASSSFLFYSPSVWLDFHFSVFHERVRERGRVWAQGRGMFFTCCLSLCPFSNTHSCLNEINLFTGSVDSAFLVVLQTEWSWISNRRTRKGFFPCRSPVLILLLFNSSFKCYPCSAIVLLGTILLDKILLHFVAYISYNFVT